MPDEQFVLMVAILEPTSRAIGHSLHSLCPLWQGYKLDCNKLSFAVIRGRAREGSGSDPAKT